MFKELRFCKYSLYSSKWGIKWRRFFEFGLFNLSGFYLKIKKYFYVLSLFYNFFFNGHIHNVVSTLPNVVKIDTEISALSNVTQIKVEIDNIDWRLLNVLNSNVDVHNVAFTLI